MLYIRIQHVSLANMVCALDSNNTGLCCTHSYDIIFSWRNKKNINEDTQEMPQS